MSKVTLISNVVSGIGPFVYNYKVVDGCGDMTFTDPDGNTGLNEIEFSSENPIITIEAEFNSEDCTEAELLGTFSLTVTGADGVCVATTEIVKTNPCYQFEASLSVGRFNGTTQEIVATAGNGNFPFTYVFTTDLIISSQQDNKITVIRTGTDNATVSVTITDSNGCNATQQLILPPANQNPELGNFSIQLVCDTDEAIVDIVALASDVDGVIDLGTIEIVQTPTKGTAVIDAAVGIITYTATPAETGTDTFSYRVRDNNGNLSNLAIATIVITPCLDVPVAVRDAFNVTCGTTTTISPLSNDTDTDGVIDRSTMELLTAPFHGSATVQSNGDVIYIPDDGYDGSDYFRYLVRDNDGQLSNIGLVSLTVTPCCDAHDASLNTLCEGSPLKFTTFATGSVPNSTSDIIEVDEGAGYAVGFFGTIAASCAEVSNPYVNLAYTLPDGTFFAPNELAADLTVTPLGGTQYRLYFDFAMNHNPDFISELRESMLNCDAVWRLTGASLPETNMSFIKDNITGIVITSGFIQFDYDNTVTGGLCAAEINAEIDDLRLYLDGLVGVTAVPGVRVLKFECLTYGTATGTLKFRRTIVRPDCPDVVIEHEVIVGDITNPCLTYSINVIQSGGGTGVVPDSINCEATVDVTNAMTLIEIVAGGSNILPSPQLLDNNGLQVIEDTIQDYLDANGGGNAVVVLSTNTLIVQIFDKTGASNFTSIQTNDAVVGNFVTT